MGNFKPNKELMKQMMMIPLLVLMLVGCTQGGKKQVARATHSFKIPMIIQSQAKLNFRYFKADSLSNVWFRFHGKYKFSDIIQWSNHYQDSTYIKDFILEYSDTWSRDEFGTDGFQIFTDYKTTIYKEEEYINEANTYFPVYIVNETSKTKMFIGKDMCAFGIQEALCFSQPNSGRWRPIDSKGFDLCGNGYFGLKVHPGEFVLLLVPKYEGSERQSMRIRLRVGNTLYISQAYKGTFNPKQFDIRTTSGIHHYLQKNKASAIQQFFYGAIPKGYDDGQ